MEITQLKDLFNLKLTADDIAPLRESAVTDAVCKMLYLYESQLIETALKQPEKWELVKQMRVELSNLRKQFSQVNGLFNRFSTETWQNPDID